MGGRVYIARRPVITMARFGIYADLDGDSQYFYRSDADFPESGITGANDLTIQAWIKPGSLVGHSMLVAKFETTDNKRMYRLYRTANELHFAISSDGTFGNTTGATSSGMNLQLTKWQYIVVVYTVSAGTVDFYLDGCYVDQGTGLKTSIADRDPSFDIGLVIGGEAYWNGGIFNVALFDDKRTPAEILASATDREIDLSGEGNLIGQWMFNEDADAAFIDNTEGDAGRDLIPYDGGDVTFGNCGRTIQIIS